MILNSLALALSLFALLVFIWISTELEEGDRKIDYNIIAENIDSSNDIKWLKSSLIQKINQEKELNKEHITFYEKAAYLQSSLAVLLILNFYYLYKTRKTLISNKKINTDYIPID